MPLVSISHLRHLIRTLSYVVSTHAADELEGDNLTGQITERQRDQVTRETEYVVHGDTPDGQAAEAIVKVGHTGKLFVITVYVC